MAVGEIQLAERRIADGSTRRRGESVEHNRHFRRLADDAGGADRKTFYSKDYRRLQVEGTNSQRQARPVSESLSESDRQPLN